MSEARKKKLPSFTTQLGLAVALCVLGGVAYWLEFSKRPAEEAAKADDKRVFPLKNRSIARFEIRNANMNIVLECASLKDKLCKPDDTSKWNLVEPVRAQGDDTTVNSLLKNFGNLTTSETVDLSTDSPEKRAQILKDYGLSPESRAMPVQRRLTFVVDGGPKYTAYFGEKHPIGDGVFTLVETDGVPNDRKIFVVPDWQLSVFTQNTAYFRDKKLFGWNEKEVTGFKLLQSRKGRGAIEATRSEDGKAWTLKLGVRVVEGDIDSIDGFLSGVLFLTAKDFVAEKKDSPGAKRALAGNSQIYDLILQTKTATKRLRLYGKKRAGKEPGRIFATLDDQDPLFEIDSFGAEKIDKAPEELRNAKLITGSERYAISEIQFQRTGGSGFQQTAKKAADGSWKVSTADGEKPVVRGRVDALLDQLSGPIIVNFAPTGDFASVGDRLRMKCANFDYEFWVRGKRVFVRNLAAKPSDVFELSPDFAGQLPWDLQYFTDENFGAAAAPKKAGAPSATAPAVPGGHSEDDGHGH